MQLTNEEKKAILDAATALSRSGWMVQCSMDRYTAISNLAKAQMGLELSEEEQSALLVPYKKEHDEAVQKFLSLLEIDLKDPWWSEQIRKAAEKEAGEGEKGEDLK